MRTYTQLLKTKLYRLQLSLNKNFHKEPTLTLQNKEYTVCVFKRMNAHLKRQFFGELFLTD
jgi:hypothetical protein